MGLLTDTVKGWVVTSESPFSSDSMATEVQAVNGCVLQGSLEGERSHRVLCVYVLSGWEPASSYNLRFAAPRGPCAKEHEELQQIK